MPVTLHQVHNMPSLVRSYKWDISFPNPPSALTDIFNLTEFGKDINIRAISTSVPLPRMEDVTAAPRGIDLHEPGLVHLDGQITLNLVDTTDLKTRRVIYALRQICMTDVEKIQQDMNDIAASYNLDDYSNSATYNPDSVMQDLSTGQGLTILLSRLNNKNRVIWHYLCMKCFLASYTDPDFDGQSSAVQPALTIQYNYFLDGAPGDGYDSLSSKLDGTGISISSDMNTGYEY